MKPEHYRSMMTRAIASGDCEVLDAMCAVLAENEAAKTILYQKGYGPASSTIEAMAKLVPERVSA